MTWKSDFMTKIDFMAWLTKKTGLYIIKYNPCIQNAICVPAESRHWM